MRPGSARLLCPRPGKHGLRRAEARAARRQRGSAASCASGLFVSPHVFWGVAQGPIAARDLSRPLKLRSLSSWGVCALRTGNHALAVTVGVCVGH